LTVSSRVAPGATVPAPAFLITIDTEGDDLWSRPRLVTTRNAEFLERFQRLCEEYGLRPTWLTSHEMIVSPTFQRFAADVIARRTAEIGMHLHAWNSPPFESLTSDDTRTNPYLIEYPPRVMRAKIHALTATLEDALGIKMVSHRAGRWAFDERYAEMLLDEGYRVDCSVTPLVSWKTTLGDPSGRGGSDYTAFPHDAYWVDLDDISRPGTSDLLEVPVTIASFRSGLTTRLVHAVDRLPPRLARVGAFAHRVADRVSPPTAWLRPTGNNDRRLCDVIDWVVHERRPYAEFMLHSSELMPGGSPTFRDRSAIEALYADLKLLFERIQGQFRGATLSEFHDEVRVHDARRLR
jgi:peptidoglycan/xylan/chitin deacetylase (PgdA/CDA1 family)